MVTGVTNDFHNIYKVVFTVKFHNVYKLNAGFHIKYFKVMTVINAFEFLISMFTDFYICSELKNSEHIIELYLYSTSLNRMYTHKTCKSLVYKLSLVFDIGNCN